jgi:hypothetical protein
VLVTATSVGLLWILTAALYLAGGVTHAYLAADDFQWLVGAWDFSGARLLDFSSRAHFYRPVVELWFAGAVTACETSTRCYHLANLAVHVLNATLVFTFGLMVSQRASVGLLGAILFVLQPAYVQAVVWVSSITILLATFFSLVSLCLQVRSWVADRRSVWYELGAVGAFAGAIFAHEASVTLPAVSTLLHGWFAPRSARFATLAGGFAVVLGLFATTTVFANQSNYVFTEGYYAFGFHAVRHALDYLVALFVAPRFWPAYAACVAGVVGLLLVNRLTRLGVLWMLITLFPYLGFTWDNVSRYLYLPAIGLALALAETLLAARGWIGGRSLHRYRWKNALVLAMISFVVLRFGLFAFKTVQSQVHSFDGWRAYVERVVAEAPEPHGRTMPIPPALDLADTQPYIEPMFRWVYQDKDLHVVLEHR